MIWEAQMDDLEAVPNPEEDLKHAHMLLSLMSPEELLKATCALEDIVEGSPRFREKMRQLNEEAAKGPWHTMEEVLDELGFDKKDFPGLVPQSESKNEAA
jgi:hypothetical protein